MDEAPAAEIGLQMIDEGAFDIVLIELHMPGMDGLTAIRPIRARSDEKRLIPVIVVTADAALDLRARCLASGVDEVIPKPVPMNLLLKTMSRMLANAAGQSDPVFT